MKIIQSYLGIKDGSKVYSKRVSVRNNLLHRSVAAEVKHDFLFDTQMSLGRETSAEKSGLWWTV